MKGGADLRCGCRLIPEGCRRRGGGLGLCPGGGGGCQGQGRGRCAACRAGNKHHFDDSITAACIKAYHYDHASNDVQYTVRGHHVASPGKVTSACSPFPAVLCLAGDTHEGKKFVCCSFKICTFPADL